MEAEEEIAGRSYRSGNRDNDHSNNVKELHVRFENSDKLKQRFHAVIPGGAHTYAKGDDQFPEFLQPYIARGEGCHVWDLDGNEFVEYGMGLRAVTLGHAYRPVVEAAYRQMQRGENYVRPASLELECAEELLSAVPGAEMVKFGKNGSDATTAAVRLARAFTGRDIVAICVDHPFYSVDDWFIGTTEMDAGIPQAVKDLTVKFHYNDIQSVASLFKQYPGKIACIFMEPERETPPRDDFLPAVQQLCRENGALFIFDEMITGFRLHLGGGQGFYNIVPDLSTFGKGLANGFSVSALVGRRDIMKLGGLSHDKERVFLMSYTHGAENHALAAALETMRIYKREPVVETLWRQGNRLAAGIKESVSKYGLGDYFVLLGRPSALVFGTRDTEKKPSQAFRTLFMQEMIKRGILAPSFVISYSHNDANVDRTINAVDEALEVYKMALEEGIEKFLRGRPVKPVLRRHN